MSANFTLALSNPAATGAVKNIAYTGLSAGNTLDLVIGNHFGYNVTIGGSSTGKYLVVQISGNILDGTGASRLGVAAPWKVDSFSAPAKPGGNYTFNLLPPAGGVDLPDKGTLQVALTDLLPSVKGNAQVIVSYELDAYGDDIQVAAPLVVLEQSNPQLPNLIGSEAPLRFSFSVNNAGATAPIQVSESPVTESNALENVLQLIFNFQQTDASVKTGGSGLVAKWDPAHPPQFRFFFPYFSPLNNSPAPIDLTDSYQSGNAAYNPITSAWNIRESLEAVNPNVGNNSFWQIRLDTNAPLPVWVVEPDASNLYLFTAAGSVPGGPGPLLNLFWSHLYSGLPIDPNNPETTLFVQWFNFPGYNDGIQVFPVLKEKPQPAPRPVIKSFSGSLQRDSDGVKLMLNWETSDAVSCFLSGDNDVLKPSTEGSPYERQITTAQPLRSEYTLTAVDSGGTYSAPCSIRLQWSVNENIPPGYWQNAVKIAVDSDANTLYVLQTEGPGRVLVPSILHFASPEDLQPTAAPFDFPAATQAYDMIAHPAMAGFLVLNGSVEYITAHAFNFKLSESQLAVSAPLKSNMPFTNWENYMTLSGNGYDFAFVPDGEQPSFFYALNSLTLENTGNSPFSLTMSKVTAFGRGPVTGRYFISDPAQINVYAADTFDQANGSPFGVSAFAIIIPPDEQQIYIYDNAGNINIYNAKDFSNLHNFFLPLIGTGYGYSYANCVTPDSSTVFIAGSDAFTNQPLIKAIYTDTMSVAPWSAWEGQDKTVLDMKISPDGSRIFALTTDGYVYVIDPSFLPV